MKIITLINRFFNCYAMLTKTLASFGLNCTFFTCYSKNRQY